MSITISKYIDVDVDLDLEDIGAVIEAASVEEKAAIATQLFAGAVKFGPGAGDAQRAATIIERAFLAAKALPNCPPEIAELFWVVHGRAMA